MSQAVKRFLFGIVFILQSILSFSQTEKKFDSLPGCFVIPLAETYDRGVICQFTFDSSKGPASLVKFSANGSKIWEKRFLNTFWINSILATSDSGFLVSATVYSCDTKLPENDSCKDVSLMKFDKCNQLQWARYIPAADYNLSGDVKEINGSYYLLGFYINPNYSERSKRLSILKFDQKGNLLLKGYFPGNYGNLSLSVDKGLMYLTQGIYLPVDQDTNITWSFGALSLLDTNFNTKAYAVPGFKSFVNIGELMVVNKNDISVIQDQSNGITFKKLMFSRYSNTLEQTHSFMFDSIKGWNIYPLSAYSINDSLLICCEVIDNFNSQHFCSLKYYDQNFKLLKEVVINKNFDQAPYSSLRLKNGDMVVSMLNFSPVSGNLQYTSLYKLDRNLNFKDWSKESNKGPFDFACKNKIPVLDSINPISQGKPLYIPIDTSKDTWSAMSSIAIEKDLDHSLRVWPNPVSEGGNIYLSLPVHDALVGINVVDEQGRCVEESSAARVSENLFHAVLPGLSPGFYFISAVDRHNKTVIGSTRISVR